MFVRVNIVHRFHLTVFVTLCFVDPLQPSFLFRLQDLSRSRSELDYAFLMRLCSSALKSIVRSGIE